MPARLRLPPLECGINGGPETTRLPILTAMTSFLFHALGLQLAQHARLPANRIGNSILHRSRQGAEEHAN